jgi:hypothetical protein
LRRSADTLHHHNEKYLGVIPSTDPAHAPTVDTEEAAEESLNHEEARIQETLNAGAE